MTPDDNFLAIPEDEYDNDPPPSYDNIGPGPISFRECIRNDRGRDNRRNNSHSHNNDRQSSRSVAQDTPRRMSFGIGGAGNINIGRRLLSIDFTHIYAQYSEYISFTTTNSSGNDPRVYLTNTKWR